MPFTHLKLCKLFTLPVILAVAGVSACLPNRELDLIKRDKPALKASVVLPVSNQTNDTSAPILLRYFAEKEIKNAGYNLAVDSRQVTHTLRQMGITDGSQINESNIRNLAQAFKADVALHGTLYQYSQEMARERTVMEARFQLIEIKTGRVLWERHFILRKDGMTKVPLPERLSYDWDEAEIRYLAKQKAAVLPKLLVREALSTLPSPGQLLRTFYRQSQD